MRKTPVMTALLASLALLAVSSSPAAAQDASALNGAWLVSSWTDTDGVVYEDSQRGLFTFTITGDDGGNYSMMFVPGSEARPRYAGENQTDAETLSAYASFIANSGRLTVEGNTLTYEAYMAKDPNYMDDWGENGESVDWAVDGTTLTLTFTSGFMEGTTATLRRAGAPAAETNPPLPSSEDPVPGVSETRKDVAFFVQLAIE